MDLGSRTHGRTAKGKGAGWGGRCRNFGWLTQRPDPRLRALNRLELPIRAAVELATRHGITPDRCEILQDANTLVLRLTESLVARVVNDVDGPRQGLDWFTRENAVAEHLTRLGAPLIPLHPALPFGPHEHLGYPVSFWQFVTIIADEPDPREIGRTLHGCHQALRSFPGPLAHLAILTESLALLDTLTERQLFPAETIELLRGHLDRTREVLMTFPAQPLHGDAHPGNVLNTTTGLRWTDWEDTFIGPVEWDLASIIWNARYLDESPATVKQMLGGYREAGGRIEEAALQPSLIARGAVMTAWYPVLYPNPTAERRRRLQRRIDWLRTVES